MEERLQPIFRKLVLASKQAKEQALFYQNILKIKTTFSQGCATIHTDTCELKFSDIGESHDFYHFSFLVYDNHFDSIYQFVKSQNLELLKEPTTGSDITIWKNMRGRSIYFYDPDRNIVEFITRPDLELISSEEWSPGKIYGINEIGTPVADPLAVAAELDKISPLIIPASFRASFGAVFTWYGNLSAVFLIVKEGRQWYPKEANAISSPLQVSIEKGKAIYSLEFRDGKFTAMTTDSISN